MSGEVEADTLPVVDCVTRLHASDAVVVSEAELIHGRQVDSGSEQDVEAFRLRDSQVDQRAFYPPFGVVLDPLVESVFFVGGVAEDFHVPESPDAIGWSLFHCRGAWRTIWRREEPLAFAHLHCIGVFRAFQRRDLLPEPLFAVRQEAVIVWVFAPRVGVVDSHGAIFFDGLFRGDGRRGTAGEPRYYAA